MRLLIVGCEYAGKTTLARRISRWMIDSMGLPYVRWHDHFVVPRLDRHLIVPAGADLPVVGKDESDLNTVEDEEILSLRPLVLEQLRRHNVWRHLYPDSFREEPVRQPLLCRGGLRTALLRLRRARLLRRSPGAGPRVGPGAAAAGTRRRAGPGRVLRASHQGPDEPLPAAPLHPGSLLPAMYDRTRIPARGFAGGEAGSVGEVVHSDGRALHAKRRYTLRPGDRFILRLPGGGGYHPPWQRDPAAVAEDVRQGYVSVQAAAERYGVVIDSATGAFDHAASAARRRALATGGDGGDTYPRAALWSGP